MSERQPTSDAATVIGKGIHIEGELTGAAPIEVWGSVDGISGTEGRFWVREGGRVGGEIAAAEVIIEGIVEGKISAEKKVEFRPTCKVQGDVFAKKVAIAEGAVFDGRIRMSDRGPAHSGGKKQGSENRAAPERSGPERSDPERSGPERNGPERNGPERNGPERSGPDAPGLSSRDRGGQTGGKGQDRKNGPSGKHRGGQRRP